MSNINKNKEKYNMIINLKKEYNSLLREEKKANIFFDDPHIVYLEKIKWLENYRQLLKNINNKLDEIMKYEKIDKNCILNGFIIQEQQEIEL